MAKPDVKIGDTLWKFDRNHRVYENNRSVFAGHFVPAKVVGETKKSWIITDRDKPRIYVPTTKDLPFGYSYVSKDELRGPPDRLGAHHYYTDEGKEHRIWIDAHQANIVRRVQACTDAAILAEIGAKLGYIA